MKRQVLLTLKGEPARRTFSAKWEDSYKGELTQKAIVANDFFKKEMAQVISEVVVVASGVESIIWAWAKVKHEGKNYVVPVVEGRCGLMVDIDKQERQPVADNVNVMSYLISEGLVEDFETIRTAAPAD